MKKNKRRVRSIGIIMLASILILSYIIFSQKDESSLVMTDESLILATEELSPNLEEEMVFVDIKGAVVAPGLYKVDASMRVNDLIQLAGGFSENADKVKVNLAERLHDEQLIYIPTVGEGGDGEVHHQSSTQKININQAGVEELQKLPGIGPSKAKEIINYRENSGKFRKKEDLLNVSGIGDRSYQRLKDYISLY